MQNEGSKNFDDIIKNKLKGLSVDASPSDWIMMERMLEWKGLTQDGEVTDETRFDEIAHDKLSNIAAGEFIPDWSKMSALIDEMNEEPSIEPSEFDQAIDNKIKDTAAGIDMAVWTRMEPILDADRMATVDELDAVTKDKLTQISEIQPAWSSMDAKINRELFLPESIVKYKVLEVALILLFAFSVSQFPLEKVKDRISENIQATRTERSIAPEEVHENIIPETSTTTIAKVAPATTSIEVNTPEEVNAVVAENVISEVAVDTDIADQQAVNLSNFELQFPPTITELLIELQDKPRFSISEFVFNQVFDPISLPRYAAMSGLFELSDLQGDNVDQSVDFEDFESTYTSFSVSEIDEPGIHSISHPTERPSVVEEDITFKQPKTALILGVFTGSDYNEIITPFDPLLAREGSSQWNVGYGGGISLGMRFKNWELETGAVYSSNQYEPSEIYDIYSGSISTGYTAFTLRDIELDIVKVPLNFRFNVNLWDKWKVYALSGATMNMVVQSEFKTDNVFFGTKTFTSPGNTAAQSTTLAQKDFGEGILEGGKFRDNSFFTANLGFGVERSLGNSWSLFAQPTYQRQIFSNGIGPNQDRYNSISLFLGTRVALSSKARLKD